MPGQQQVATRFAFLRQGWFYIVGVVALSLIRKWLLSRGIERPPPRGERRAAPVRDSRERRSPQAQQPGSRPHAAHGAASNERTPRKDGSQHQHKPAESAPVTGASEEEMGSQWHFEGCRRWLWLHDGSKPNGWVEFGVDGILRTSLCTGGRGAWERRANDEMVLTFGKCHHMIVLLTEAQGQAPMFELRERSMKDGSPLRGRPGVRRSRGRLEVESGGQS